MSAFWKKYNNYLFFGALLIILLVPQIRFPVQVFLQRLIAFSPSVIKEEKRETLNNYDYVLVNHAGEVVNLSAFQDKVILLNFWATWCPPCVAEMPALQELYNDYKEKVVFLFVSNDPLGKVTQFANNKGLDLPFYAPQSNEPSELSYSALPTTFVINKKGSIVMRKEGAASWNSSSVRKLLDELVEE